MPIWLLESDALENLKSCLTMAVPDKFVLSGDGIMRISGDVAVIEINGILTPKPDRWAAFFGGGNTAYSDIISAIGEANADDRIKQIRIEVDSSPGGKFTGLIPAMDAIRESGKQITAYVSEAALSGGYMLVSQAQGGVYAKHRATMFGSFGVAQRLIVRPEIVDITNTDSPDKRPDVSTAEGRAVVQEELDKVQHLIVETIAKGRGLKPAEVVKRFGRGAMFPAGDALTAGMIDGIGLPVSTASTGKKEGSNMDLTELQATHPELVEAIQAAAIKAERERVSAHLVLGEASGDMARAIGDVRSGAAVTQETTAFHMAASIKAAAKRDRVDDNPSLGNTPAPEPEKTAEQLLDEKICAAMTWADDPENSGVTYD